MTKIQDVSLVIQRHIDAGLVVSERTIAALAQLLLETVADSNKVSLQSLDGQLINLVKAAIRKVPSDQLSLLASEQALASPTASIHALGVLELAQTLISRANCKLIDEGFIELCKDTDCVEFLYNKPLTNTELAKANGLRLETVSRKLHQLTEAGVTDFRMKGRERLNFLTPAARSIYDDLLLEANNHKQNYEVESVFTELMEKVTLPKRSSFSINADK